MILHKNHSGKESRDMKIIHFAINWILSQEAVIQDESYAKGKTIQKRKAQKQSVTTTATKNDH